MVTLTRYFLFQIPTLAILQLLKDYEYITCTG